MSKRRSDNVQAGRTKGIEGAIVPGGEEPRPTPTLAGSSGEAPEGSPLGGYWFAVILWTIGFGSMIAFEVIAAVFRR